MESVMLYIVVGLCVFVVKLTAQKLHPVSRLLTFALAGTASGLFVASIAGFPMPAAPLPVWLGGVIGLFAGIVLFYLDRFDWVERPVLAYLTTILPATLLAVLLYAVTYIYMSIFSVPVQTRITGLQMWTLFAAAGFAMVLGFTLPERWFRRRGMYSEDNSEA